MNEYNMDNYDYFLEKKEEWLADERYKNKYIAIYKGKIIDVGDNAIDLVKKISKEHYIHPPYIIKVQSDLPVSLMISAFSVTKKNG
jgi:Family of unknown function (DUF5678)